MDVRATLNIDSSKRVEKKKKWKTVKVIERNLCVRSSYTWCNFEQYYTIK